MQPPWSTSSPLSSPHARTEDSRSTIAPSSLPAHFRYNNAAWQPSSPFSPPPFFRPDDAPPVQTVHNTPPKTRLEVLSGCEVSVAVLSQYAASVLALVYLVIQLRFFAAHWATHHAVPPPFPLERLFDAVLQSVSFLLPLVFALNLLFARAVTDEQLWTLILLIVGLFATNPLTRSESNFAPRLIVNDAVYTATIYLYLFLAAHSYRVFNMRSIHTTAFYLPKLAAAAVYLLVKLVAGFYADVSLGLVPYARLLTWLLLHRSGRSSLRVTIPVILTTCLDTIFGFWLVHQVAATSEFLATVPYVENRSKQLGFRCFVYQTLAFCFNMIGLSLLITYMIPRSYLYHSFDNPQGQLLQLEPSVGRFGLAFVYVTWTLVLAYVNLPPTPMLPFAQRLVSRALHLVRNNRVAVWLGLADIVETVDAEDSDDDREVTAHPAPRAHHDPTPTTTTTIPLRYRHREAYDDIVSSCNHEPLISPLVLSTAWPQPGGDDPSLPRQPPRQPPRPSATTTAIAITPASPTPTTHQEPSDTNLSQFVYDDLPTNEYLATYGGADVGSRSRPREIFGGSAAPSAPVPLPSQYRPYDFLSPQSSETMLNLKRLRMRKNLFVMETAVMMVNASYLSYIPGNPNEERTAPQAPSWSPAPLLHTGSLADDLDGLVRQIAEENEMLDSHSGSDPVPEREQPDHDDGTRFRVDPYEMAERYGYKLYKHFCDDRLNIHAIVLINSTRVIVAFSGTRDVSNWSVSANFKRAVLDEKLGRFEYERSSDNGPAESGNISGELSLESFDYRTLEGNLGRDFGTDSRSRSEAYGLLRSSRSEERLNAQMEDGLLGHHRSFGPRGARQTRYGTLGTSDRRESRGLVSSRTHHGVTMVATAFAKELLTFGQPKVHGGFIDAYMSLRKRVMGTLVELYGDEEEVEENGNSSSMAGAAKSLPLFLCGHSLGGALATFAAYEAARYYKRIGISRRQDISCTTFGCPRLGNEAFKARYERLVETHWRFEIAADPIPRALTLFLNYVPVGVQVLIDQSGMLLIDPSFIEKEWWGQLSNLYLGYRFHIRASYCMALRTYCKLYKNGSDDLSEKFWPFPIRIQTKGLFRHAQQ